MCETCCVNGRHSKNMLNIKISRHTLVYYYLWNVLAKFHENPSNLHTLQIRSKWCIPPKFICEILRVKVPNQLAPHLEIMTPEKIANQLDCEQSLFGQSRLSSAGLEIANWPRGELERGGKKRDCLLFWTRRVQVTPPTTKGDNWLKINWSVTW